MTYMVEIKNLEYSYKDHQALKGLDFSLKSGDFLSFLGPNGAGKSTTIKLMATLLKIQKGDIYIGGLNVKKSPEKARALMGIVYQESYLDGALTLEENLYVRGSLYGLRKKQVLQQVHLLKDYLQVEDIFKRRIDQLSGGEKRRADLIRGLIHSPELLILDEPTTGLDPSARRSIWACIEALRKDKGLTIFLTTHYMEETEAADQVILMSHGKITAQGTPYDLKKQYAKDQIKLYSKASLDPYLKTLNQPYTLQKGIYTLEVESSLEALDFLSPIKDQLEDFEVIKGSMEDVYLQTSGERLAQYD